MHGMIRLWVDLTGGPREMVIGLNFKARIAIYAKAQLLTLPILLCVCRVVCKAVGEGDALRSSRCVGPPITARRAQ